MFIPSRLSSDDCWCVVRLLLVCAMMMAPCLGVGEGTGWGLNEWFQGIRLSGAAEGVGCKRESRQVTILNISNSSLKVSYLQ